MQFLLPVAVVAMTMVTQARANDGPWFGHLTPERHEIQSGDALGLTYRDSSRDLFPWPAVDHLFVRVAGTQLNLDATTATDEHTFHQVLDQAGVAMVGMDLRPEPLQVAVQERSRLEALIPGSRLAQFLGAFDRDHELRLLHHRSSTTLVVVSDSHTPFRHSGTAQSKAGQRAEIRLLADPTLQPKDSDLPLRAYVHGASLAHANIVATHVPRSVVAGNRTATLVRKNVSTNESGIGRLHLDQAGLWQIEFHDIRVPDDPGRVDIDGELYSATLNFVVPGEEDDR